MIQTSSSARCQMTKLSSWNCVWSLFFVFFLKGSRHLQSLPECTGLCTTASPAKDSSFSCPPSLPSETSSLTGVMELFVRLQRMLFDNKCVLQCQKIQKLKCMTWRSGRKFSPYKDLVHSRIGEIWHGDVRLWFERHFPRLTQYQFLSGSRSFLTEVPVQEPLVRFKIFLIQDNKFTTWLNKHMHKGRGLDQIIARDLLHHLILKKWPWSRSKILETQRKNTLSMPLWCQFCE